MADQGLVERATRADLRRLGVSVQRSGLAAAAVALAKQIDATDVASGAAAAARELRTILGELATVMARTQELTSEPEGDAVDDLARRRADRRSG